MSDREFLILKALEGNIRQGLYGLEIRGAVASDYGVRLPLGSLYVMLSRLVEKGFVERIDGEPASGDPQARRQYYKIAALGAHAVTAKARLLSSALVGARTAVRT